MMDYTIEDLISKTKIAIEDTEYDIDVDFYFNKLEKKLAENSKKPLKWNRPEAIPDVELGCETLFWIAVHLGSSNKQHVFLAHYQNRPVTFDEDGYPLEDWALTNEDGGEFGSVGWVSRREHNDFDGYYEELTFNDEYKLLGWAEYVPPQFTGCGE